MQSFSLIPFPARPMDVPSRLRTLLCDAVVSPHSRRAYAKALDDFLALSAANQQPICRASLMAYRTHMIAQGLSASTINQRLCAMRKLVSEARDNGLLDAIEAERILTVPGVPEEGIRLGTWLTADETRRLLAVPDRSRLIGKRGYAILSVLVHCALRREELARLEISRIQQREGRWVIADLVGKRKRVRTVPLPAPAKLAIDEWMSAARINSGPLFRCLRKGGVVTEAPLSAWSIWDVVVRAAAAAGIERIGPHDLRRTCAKLCRRNGGKLEQIQYLMGHATLLTTEKYLGGQQHIGNAPNDHLNL
jgi:integrase